MTYSLSNNCTKNYYNRTLTVQVIVEDVVTWIFLRHSVVTCIDPFSKWAEAFPVPNKEAPTIARVLVEQVMCRFGTPIAGISDRCREVDGRLMAEICRLLDIDKMRPRRITPAVTVLWKGSMRR